LHLFGTDTSKSESSGSSTTATTATASGGGIAADSSGDENLEELERYLQSLSYS
jgi:hypothetical protein